MATYTRTYANNTGGTGIKSSHCITLTDKTDSINNICPNIPDYSVINNVTIAFEWKTSLGSSNGDCNIDIDRDNSNYFSTVSLGKQIGALSQVDNDYTWVTRDKSSSIENTNARLPDYFNSGKSNVGQYSGSYTLCIWFSASVIRKFYWRNLTMKFDYTPPTYVISLTAGTGGTVSGAGTYNVGSTATIKATPNTGYKFVKWSDGDRNAERKITITSSDISANVTNLSYTATFEKTECTVNFKNQDGSVVKTSNIQQGATLGTVFKELPTVSRSGYTFGGWIPCAPAVKTDDSVLDSRYYAGDKNSAQALHRKYLYDNNLSIHIEAYMEDWDDIKNRQIISCTEEGGWGLGYMANSSGKGAEIQAGGYKGIDLGFGTPSNFTDKSWYTFDVVFSNGVFEAYLNNVKKGSVTTNNTTITYKYENAIFVGAESGKTTTAADGNYFKGYISNVFIANQGTKLEIATADTIVEDNIDYYPIWRINTAKSTNMLIDLVQVRSILIDNDIVKGLLIDTTRIF